MPAKSRKPQRKIRIPYVDGRMPTGSTRSAVFLPNEEHLVRMLAAKGATDAELEMLCGVPNGTLEKWRKQYPSLNEWLEKGRTKVDGDVLYALYRNAVGFEYEEETAAGKDGHVVLLKKQRLPETAAQKAWLYNRKRDEWSERATVAGDKDKPVSIEHSTKRDIIDAILGLVTPKPDNEATRTADER